MKQIHVFIAKLGDIIMWQTKLFKSYDAMNSWILKHQASNQIDIIYINNAYGVEYRPLRKVY